MADDYQIDIPPSFFALYTDGRQRLREPLPEVRRRYDLCEDLANILIGPAQLQQHAEVPVEADILRRIRSGLGGPDAVVSTTEADWVVCRLAELLDWPMPRFAGADEA